MESHATGANAEPLGFDWWSTASAYLRDLESRNPFLYRCFAGNMDRLLFELWSEMSTGGGDIDRRATGDDNSSEDPDYNVWGGWGTSTTVSPIRVAGALSQTASCASAPKALPSTSTTAPPSPKLTTFTDASALSALPPLDDDDGWKQLRGSSTEVVAAPSWTAGDLEPSRPRIAPSSAPPNASDWHANVDSPSSASPRAPRERSRSRRRPVESASSSSIPLVDQLLSEHAANQRLQVGKASLRLPRPPSVPPPSLAMIGNLETTHATAQPKSSGRKPPQGLASGGGLPPDGGLEEDALPPEPPPDLATPEAVPDLTPAGAVSKARPRAPPIPASARLTATGAIYFASPLEARQWCQQKATTQQGRQD